MSATYAGVEICQTTPDLRNWIERNMSISEFREFNWAQSGPNIFHGLTYFQHNESNVPVRLNVLRWPSMASRWGTYHFVATEEQLEDIRASIYGDLDEDYNNSPAKLILHRAGETITCSDMWLMSPRPLSATPDWIAAKNTLWLCTLVDQRYWWNQDHCDKVDGIDNWSDLLTWLKNRAGIVDSAWDCASVHADWLKPHTQLRNVNSLPLGLMIDAIAWNVGRRVSVDYERTSDSYPPVVHVREWDWHNTRLQQNLTHANWYRLAGGEFFPDDRDYSPALPEKIRLTFSVWDDPRESVELNIVDVTGYEPYFGSGTVTFHDRLEKDETDSGERELLLERIADAYLGFQSHGTADVAYSHHVKWLPEALTDAIEWHEQHGEGADLVPDPEDGKVRQRKTLMDIARTRAIRLPWNWAPDDMWHGGDPVAQDNKIVCPDASEHPFTITHGSTGYTVTVE